jgi:hypothetical protein
MKVPCRPALALLVLFFVLAACGGDDTSILDASDIAAQAENDVAQSFILTVSDFPSGWSETPVGRDDDTENPFGECDKEPSSGRTGAAETGNFSQGTAATISQKTAVFVTQEDAVSSLVLIEQIADCLIEVVNSGKLDSDEFEYSNATFGTLSFASFGDATDAYRLEIQSKAKSESGLGEEEDLYLDIVRVIDGRLGFAIQTLDAESPFDIATLESIVTIAHDKLADIK